MLDTGKLFSPDLPMVPDNNGFTELKRRGRGRYLMYQLMDEVKYESVSGEGNKLTLVKYKR